MPHRINDRVALIVGASSGVGEVIILATELRAHIGHAKVKKRIDADSLGQLQPKMSPMPSRSASVSQCTSISMKY